MSLIECANIPTVKSKRVPPLLEITYVNDSIDSIQESTRIGGDGRVLPFELFISNKKFLRLYASIEIRHYHGNRVRDRTTMDTFSFSFLPWSQGMITHG
jgi:hypothetical protein